MSDETPQDPNIQNDEARRDESPADDGSSTDRQRTPSQEPFKAPRFINSRVEEGLLTMDLGDREPLRCEDEPVHTPGAVQGFGMLIGLTEEEPGRFVVRLASENSREFIGYTPKHLFGLGSIMDIFSEEQEDNIQTRINSIRDDVDNLTISGPEIFNTSIKRPDGKRVKLWCAAHINPNRPELIVCEFEREDDPDYPLIRESPSIPSRPANTPVAIATDKGLVGTQSTSKPLKVTRGTRLGNNADPMQIFDILGQIQNQLAEATSMDGLLRALVGIVKEISSYHKVLIYQFDAASNGKVVAELVDADYTGDIYYGHQFPASDIPAQARELYKVNKMRFLYDRELHTARMVCRSKADLDTPLDMTHCYLRAQSPIHMKYNENMNIRSAMSLSLKLFGKLWGLVSCHNFGSSVMRPSYPIRKICQLISNIASRNFERIANETSLQAQKLVNSRLVDSTSGSSHLIASKDELLEMFQADFGVVSILGETKTIGRSSQTRESLAVTEYLREKKKPTDIIASHDITSDFPDLEYAPGFTTLGGVLFAPLSPDSESYIAMFRKSQDQEVKWGGNPHENKLDSGAGPLRPRSSFKTWLEVVTGRSREWSADQIELATVLCTVYGKFIQVWKEKEPPTHGTSRLTQLLLANSAHQVRTPLNAIINYLEMALEGPLDNETRDSLAQSHSASKSLVCVINDLLDLTKTEEGKTLTRADAFDLPACIRQVTDNFLGEAKRKHLKYEVEMHSELPRDVCGDNRQVRTAVTNIVANAFQNTSDGFVKVTAYVAEATDDKRMRVEIAVQDTGVGMSTEDMNGLFHELEQVSHVEPDDDDPRKYEEGKKLGLGLAVVSRIVRNMDGLLRISSELGQGSCFVIQLPFDLPGGPEGLSKGQVTASKQGGGLATDEPGILSRTTDYSNAEVTLTQRADKLSLVTPRGSVGGLQVGKPGSTDDTGDKQERRKTQASPDHGTATAGTQAPKASVPGPVADGVDKEGPPATPAGPKDVASKDTSEDAAEKKSHLHVLIAEDDPINVMLLKKRLQKVGHEIHHSLNGEECAAAYRQRSQSFDVVLMDMQMPIMDGMSSTKAIRSWERDPQHQGLSPRARCNGRIPIFAVSASLVEESRGVYMEAGFDGWIPKPIDFQRLCKIMAGIDDEEARATCVYAPGKWVDGGWFEKAGGAVG